MKVGFYCVQKGGIWDMPTEEEKIESIKYFLNNVLNNEYPLNVRKQEMIRQGKKFCQGFPEWSDFWGNKMRAIDDISLSELEKLLNKI